MAEHAEEEEQAKRAAEAARKGGGARKGGQGGKSSVYETEKCRQHREAVQAVVGAFAEGPPVELELASLLGAAPEDSPSAKVGEEVAGFLHLWGQLKEGEQSVLVVLSIDEKCQTQPPSAILFTKNACGPVIETTTVQKLAEHEGLSASLRSLCNPAAVLEVLNVLTRSAPDLMQIAKGGTPAPDGAILQDHGIIAALANFVSEGGSIRTPGGLASPHSCVVATAADKTKVEIVVNQMKNAQQRIGDVSREVCMRSRLSTKWATAGMMTIVLDIPRMPAALRLAALAP
mmetsp:Transcript_4745/g.15426  ORF Transcript_4745/g.15426 Transcript_4745/m.15426 type:complete len:288 (-) Transcript_4745:405-1268(-)